METVVVGHMVVLMVGIMFGVVKLTKEVGVMEIFLYIYNYENLSLIN